MPRNSKHQHTAKADRMARHIEKSAKEEGRYKGREKQVAWATVHKDMSRTEAHGKKSRK
jgi:hypothetical protein